MTLTGLYFIIGTAIIIISVESYDYIKKKRKIYDLGKCSTCGERIILERNIVKLLGKNHNHFFCRNGHKNYIKL